MNFLSMGCSRLFLHAMSNKYEGQCIYLHKFKYLTNFLMRNAPKIFSHRWRGHVFIVHSAVSRMKEFLKV